MKVTCHKSQVTSVKVLIAFCILHFAFCISSHAQSERKLIRDGNKLYKEKKFTDAEVNYKKSLNLNKESPTGKYNLGDAYYKQGKFDDAAQLFQPLASDKNLSDDQKVKAFHNLGNSFLQSKKYDESINAYKNALKLNPKDNDTRYNLAYAQSMLQQQQQQQKKDDQKKDDKKDNKDQKQQQNKEQDKKEQQKQQQQQQKQKISKEDAEKILQALNNDEKNAQKKLAKKETTRVSIEKNW